LLKGFILTRKVEGVSPRTTAYYEEKLGNFLWYCEQHVLTLSDLNTDTIREFLVYLKDSSHRWDSNNTRANRALSPRSIQHYYGCLRTFFNWLVDEGYVEYNPVLSIKPPRAPKKLIRALSQEEMSSLLSEYPGRDFKDVRNRAMLMLFLDTGLRLAELGNITLEDMTLDRQTIFVTGKGSKQRMVRFGSVTAKALWKYLALRNTIDGHSKNLWLGRSGHEMRPTSIASLFKRLEDKTGIKVNPHKLRHTYAISALRNGMNPFVLQASLGHASLDMTRRYCASLGFEDVFREHEKASPVDRLKR